MSLTVNVKCASEFRDQIYPFWKTKTNKKCKTNFERIDSNSSLNPLNNVKRTCHQGFRRRERNEGKNVLKYIIVHTQKTHSHTDKRQK